VKAYNAPRSLGGSGGVVHGLPPPSASGGSGLTYLSASDRRGATHLPPLQNIMSRAAVVKSTTGSPEGPW
jgi:hypothetical protein